MKRKFQTSDVVLQTDNENTTDVSNGEDLKKIETKNETATNNKKKKF